jgi:hypothetical protein
VVEAQNEAGVAVAAGGMTAVCAAIAGMCREQALRAPWSELEAEDGRIADSGDDRIETADYQTFDAIDEVPFPVASPNRSASIVEAQPGVLAPSGREALPSPPDMEDAFATFTRILEDALMAAGGSPQGALLLRALLGELRLEGRSVPRAAEEALIAGKHATMGIRGLTRTPELVARVVAWQSFLRGETDEVGASVTQMLDEWAADLVSRVMGEPGRAPAVKRELRSRGVAAFGLVADAA